MKKASLKKFSALFMVVTLIVCMLLSGCAGRRSVAADEFTAACESAGYTLTDESAYYTAMQIDTVLLYIEGNTSIGYYHFVNAADAKSQYAQLFSQLNMGSSEEKFIDSAEYNRYYASTDNAYALLYRNGSNLIHIIGTDGESLEKIVDQLGI